MTAHNLQFGANQREDGGWLLRVECSCGRIFASRPADRVDWRGLDAVFLEGRAEGRAHLERPPAGLPAFHHV